MIGNLNQLTFREFGKILPEKTKNVALPGEGIRITLPQDAEKTPICRAVSEVWIRALGGLTVLSTRGSDGVYQNFHLDKVVCIRPGVCFSLFAFRGSSEVEVMSAQEPEILGDREPESLLLQRSLRISNIYTFFYQEKERGFIFSGESHPMVELTYVDQGKLHSVADGQDLLLEQGELALYGPDQWHMQYAEMDTAVNFVTVTFDLEGTGWQELLNRKWKASQRSVTLLKQLLRERDHADAYTADMILCLLTQFLLTVLRESGKDQNAPLKTANAVHSENEIISRAQQYIGAHIREKLTVPLVARMVDVSPSYLTALFHKNLQISPGEYIRRVKLQESKQMIREDHMNFTEIAAALHYSTVHHFSRQFKEKFGITPTEYAKSIR